MFNEKSAMAVMFFIVFLHFFYVTDCHPFYPNHYIVNVRCEF